MQAHLFSKGSVHRRLIACGCTMRYRRERCLICYARAGDYDGKYPSIERAQTALRSRIG